MQYYNFRPIHVIYISKAKLLQYYNSFPPHYCNQHKTTDHIINTCECLVVRRVCSAPCQLARPVLVHVFLGGVSRCDRYRGRFAAKLSEASRQRLAYDLDTLYTMYHVHKLAHSKTRCALTIDIDSFRLHG